MLRARAPRACVRPPAHAPLHAEYNTLKVSRHLFQWSADVRQADFYERALLNGILGNMNAVNGP